MASGTVNTGIKKKTAWLGAVSVSANNGTYQDYSTDLGERIVSVTCITNCWQVTMKVGDITNSYIRVNYWNPTSSKREFSDARLLIAYI